MAEKHQQAVQALRAILAEDRAILGRRDELAEKIGAADLPWREKITLRTALQTSDICGMFAAADETPEERATVGERALASLQEQHQRQSAERVVAILTAAMGWDDAPAEKEAPPEAVPAPAGPPEAPAPEVPAEEAAPAKQEEAPADAWDCLCGKTGNTGNFCSSCGRPRPGSTQAPAATARPAFDATQVLSQMPADAAPAPEPPRERPRPAQSAPPPQRAIPIDAPAAPPAQKSGGHGCLTVVVVLLAILGFFYFRSDSGSRTDSSSTSVQETSSSAPAAAKIAREMKSDLSLGGLDLDMSIDDVRKALGRENTSEQRGKFDFLLYDDVEVGTYENTVRALVSDSPSAQTKRGIHEGSSLADVTEAYGAGAMVTDYDDLMLYEYAFRSIAGSDGILRFAVKKSDHTVKYISVRIPEDEKPAAKADSKLDPNEAAQALNEYYQDITGGRTNAAYHILSDDMQRHMGTLGQFADGYRTTLSHKLTDLTLVAAEGDKVTIGYTLTARDRTNTSRVKVQTFRCEATLSKATGSWHIVDMSAKKQGERME